MSKVRKNRYYSNVTNKERELRELICFVYMNKEEELRLLNMLYLNSSLMILHCFMQSLNNED